MAEPRPTGARGACQGFWSSLGLKDCEGASPRHDLLVRVARHEATKRGENRVGLFADEVAEEGVPGGAGGVRGHVSPVLPSPRP